MEINVKTRSIVLFCGVLVGEEPCAPNTIYLSGVQGT